MEKMEKSRAADRRTGNDRRETNDIRAEKYVTFFTFDEDERRWLKDRRDLTIWDIDTITESSIS